MSGLRLQVFCLDKLFMQVRLTLARSYFMKNEPTRIRAVLGGWTLEGHSWVADQNFERRLFKDPQDPCFYDNYFFEQEVLEHSMLIARLQHGVVFTNPQFVLR